MVTSIQLGNIFTQNGKTIVSGGATGFDIEELVDGLAEIKRQPAVVLEEKIAENAEKAEAFQDMKDLLTAFKDAANFLRNPPGVNNESENIFEYRSVTTLSNTSVSASNYINVTASPGAALGEHTITVDTLATRNIQTTNTFAVADTSTNIVDGSILSAGTLTLGASGVDVQIETGDSIDMVIAKVNAVKDSSGVEASYIKVSDGNYRLSFTTTETGADVNYTITASIFNVGFAISQTAVDAKMTIDGTEITRSSNNFSDVLDDVTFELLQETPTGTSIQANIGADTELVKTGIINFVDAYNAFKLYASAQMEYNDDGTAAETAILANDPTLRLTLNKVVDEMSAEVDGILGDNLSALSDIGITFSDFPGDDNNPYTRNIITLDETKLQSAIDTQFDEVRDIFEFNYTSDNANFQIYSHTVDLSITDFTVNVDTTAKTYTATYTIDSVETTVTLEAETLSNGDLTLTGPSGSAIEDVVMIFSNPTTATIKLHATQGIADRIYDVTDSLLEEDVGAVEVAIDSLAEETERYEEDIAKIDEQIEDYRQQLLEKFAALESAITQANTLLASLDAQANAQNNS